MRMSVHKARCNVEKGFTLIELVIVIAIIAILAWIAIPQYKRYIQISHVAAVAANVKRAVTATTDAFATVHNSGSINIMDTINGAKTLGDPANPSAKAYISGASAACGQVGFSPSVVTESTPSVTITVGGTYCRSKLKEDLFNTLKQKGIPVILPEGTITIMAEGKIGG